MGSLVLRLGSGTQETIPCTPSLDLLTSRPPATEQGASLVLSYWVSGGFVTCGQKHFTADMRLSGLERPYSHCRLEARLWNAWSLLCHFHQVIFYTVLE